MSNPQPLTSTTQVDPSPDGAAQTSSHANKVAKVTALFWVMKIAATTLGETAGDLFSMTLGVGYAVSSIVLLSLFAVTLVAQLRARRFHPALYWTVILATSTAGTTMSDFMDRTLGLGYATGSMILIFCLVTTLIIWRLSVGTLSVDHIATPRAETFYWVSDFVFQHFGHRRRRFSGRQFRSGIFGRRGADFGRAAVDSAGLALHLDFAHRPVLGGLCADATFWRDLWRSAHQNARQRRFGFWHYRLVGDSGGASTSKMRNSSAKT